MRCVIALACCLVLAGCHEAPPDVTYFPDGAVFPDLRRGVVRLDPFDPCEEALTCDEYLEVTRDGGETWSRIDETELPELDHEREFFATFGREPRLENLRVIATARTAWAIDDGSTYRRLRVTHDGGRTWHTADPCPRFAMRDEPIVDAPSDRDAWVVCEQPDERTYTLHVTHDGGRTFREIASSGDGLPQYDWPVQLGFHERGFGLVVLDSGKLLVTRDGGGVFETVRVGKGSRGFPSVVGPSSAYVFVDSIETVSLHRTDDAGRTWRLLRTWTERRR